nr:MAG: hypothetical protein J07AB56_11740 [Candidatus Nanosalinarum sp. J07AB56]
MIEHLKREYSDHETSTKDGIKVHFEGGVAAGSAQQHFSKDEHQMRIRHRGSRG